VQNGAGRFGDACGSPRKVEADHEAIGWSLREPRTHSRAVPPADAVNAKWSSCSIRRSVRLQGGAWKADWNGISPGTKPALPLVIAPSSRRLICQHISSRMGTRRREWARGSFLSF
jgi:hypothetical protein